MLCFNAANELVNYIGAPTNTQIYFSQNSSTGHQGLWIDWNNDMDFDDTGEQVYLQNNSTVTINIPAGTPAGTYRMRLATAYIGNLNPCGNCNVGVFGF